MNWAVWASERLATHRLLLHELIFVDSFVSDESEETLVSYFAISCLTADETFEASLRCIPQAACFPRWSSDKMGEWLGQRNH